jgi:hypothetical protein
MPYGQSAWGEAADAIGGTAQNMNQMALAIARMRYMRAEQERRAALQMGQLALRAHLDQSTMDKNQSLAKAADSRRLLDDIRRSVDQRKAQVASQLGGQEFANRMPRPSGDIEADQFSGPGGIDEQAGMAKVASLAEELRGLHGTPVDPYAQHNIPQGGTAVSQFQAPVEGQPKPVTPFMHNVAPGGTVLGRNGEVLYQSPSTSADKNLSPNEAVRARTGFMFDETDPATKDLVGITISNALARAKNGPTGGPRPPRGTTSANGSQPKTITDKDGKKWIYKGSMADPTQDRDEANWEEVGDAAP